MMTKSPRDIVHAPLIKHVGVGQIRTYVACKEHFYFVTGGNIKI